MRPAVASGRFLSALSSRTIPVTAATARFSGIPRGATTSAGAAAAAASARGAARLPATGGAPCSRGAQRSALQPLPAAGGVVVRAFSGRQGAEMPLHYRPPIEIRPDGGRKHTATCIMLHGLGDSGDGWAAIGDEFAAALPHVKWVFPHAPLRSITLNMGMSMPGWYDITSLEDINQREDGPGLVESKRYIESLVAAEEAEGVPSNRIVVAGFSQGGAVALMMLRSQKKLAAIVGLSTYLPLRDEEGIISPENVGTPILQAHGDQDNVVDYGFGVSTHQTLKGLGAPADFLTVRGMGHSAAPAELEAVKDFIAQVVPPQQ